MRLDTTPLLQVVFPMLVCISSVSSVQRLPRWLIFEEAHRLNIVVIIGREPVVDTGRQDDQIVLLESDPDPVIALISDVEVACTVSDVSDLLVLMHVLIEKHLHFRLVNLTHGFWRDGNLISILVVALFGEHVNGV